MTSLEVTVISTLLCVCIALFAISLLLWSSLEVHRTANEMLNQNIRALKRKKRLTVEHGDGTVEVFRFGGIPGENEDGE